MTDEKPARVGKKSASVPTLDDIRESIEKVEKARRLLLDDAGQSPSGVERRAGPPRRRRLKSPA